MLEILDSKKMMEGQGVVVNRLFPVTGGRMNHDPFVLFDHFAVEQGQGFDTHPHRGFEAITYLFSGSMNHKDNLGNDSTVSGGGAQIFCAGRGISHSEMPAGKETTRGIQFWINLEKKLKTIEPSYQLVAAEEIPVLDFDGGSRTIIVGEGSPVKLQNDISYEYISLDNGASYKLEGIGGLHGLIYLLSGKLEVGKEMLEDAQSLLFDGDNKSLLIKAHTESRFMLASGRPHCEPIRQFGPYVD